MFSPQQQYPHLLSPWLNLVRHPILPDQNPWEEVLQEKDKRITEAMKCVVMSGEATDDGSEMIQ